MSWELGEAFGVPFTDPWASPCHTFGFADLNNAWDRTRLLDFIHNSPPLMSSHSEPIVSLKRASEVFVQFRKRKGQERAREGERAARQTGRSGSRLASSRQQRSRLRPKRCGTDGGGLRHRKKRRTPHHSKHSRPSLNTTQLTAFRSTDISRFLSFTPLKKRRTITDAWGRQSRVAIRSLSMRGPSRVTFLGCDMRALVTTDATPII